MFNSSETLVESMDVLHQTPFYGNGVSNIVKDNVSVPGYRPVEFQPSHNQTKDYTKIGTCSSPTRKKKTQEENNSQQSKIASDPIQNYKSCV